MSDDITFSQHAVAVATSFWGVPNKSLSTAKKVCWGSNGSKSVSVEKGTWFDYESDQGGGVLNLVERELGCDKSTALKWLTAEGYLESRDMATERHQERREAPQAAQLPPEQDEAPAGTMVAVKGYDYTDRDGNLLYQVVRYQWKLPDGGWVIDPKTGNPKKTFRQRRKDSAGNVVWNLDGIGHTIFRHAQVEIAIAEGKLIFLPEGEKDVETLEAWGLVGTTNSGGASHWDVSHAELFRDADVVILVDNDDAGRVGGEKRAMSLRGIARRVRVLDFSERVPNFMSKGDVTDWVEKFGGDASKLVEIINTLPDWTPAPPISKFGAKRTTQIAHAPIIYDWLVKGLIERNGVLMFAGEKQAGKSFAVMDMGMKIARGLEYGDRRVRQGLVIHMACEDGRGTEMRAEGYRRENGIADDADIPYIIMDPNAKGAGGFTLMSDEKVDAFIAECLAWQEWFGQKLEFIIIDTLSKATEGLNEIDGAEVGKVLARADRIKDKTGATVCLVHHMNASGARMRGHSSIGDNVPNIIEIRPMTTIPKNRHETAQPILDGNGAQIRQMVLTKNKNGLNNLKWRVVLKIVSLGLDADGDPITTCVCARPARSTSSEAEERQTISQDQKLVFDALRAAQDNDGQDMPHGTMAGPQIKRCAPQAAFVGYVRKTMTFKAAEDEIEARNGELAAFLKRTTTSLQNAGYMGRDNDLKIVWWTGKSDRPAHRQREPEPERPPPIDPDLAREFAQSDAPF